MRMNVAKINEHRQIVAGVVKQVRPGTGTVEGKVVNIKLEGEVWNNETKTNETKTLEIAFWNTDTAAMADRITAAKVSEGSVITVDVYERDGKFTGNAFKYKGHWIVPATDAYREKNIFMGTVASMQEGTTASGQVYTRISMPIDARDGSETEWASITFWNSDLSNVADRAKKVLGGRNGKKSKAIVIAGEARMYNDRKQYSGYDFILIPDNV